MREPGILPPVEGSFHQIKEMSQDTKGRIGRARFQENGELVDEFVLDLAAELT